MALPDQTNPSAGIKRLTRTRIALALAIAVVADAGQLFLLPLAWTFLQSAVDVVAGLLVMALLGFHVLLLPTFALELIPAVDALPTWTACTLAVIALRKRRERLAEKPPVD